MTVAALLRTLIANPYLLPPGILARDNAVTHAAILHAASLHPHFMAFTLRDAARAPPPTAQHTAQLHGGGDGGGAATNTTAGDKSGAMPLPAVYTATGGYRDHWVYGKRV
jgi:hypothetical protein